MQTPKVESTPTCDMVGVTRWSNDSIRLHRIAVVFTDDKWKSFNEAALAIVPQLESIRLDPTGGQD